MDEKYIRLDRRIYKNLPANNGERLLYLEKKYKKPFKVCFCELCAETTWTTVDGVFAEIAPLLTKNRWDNYVYTINGLEDNIIDKTWTFIEKDKGRFSVSRHFFSLCFKLITKSRRDNLDSYGKTYYKIFIKRLQKLEINDPHTWLTNAIEYAENEIDFLVKENEYVSLVVQYLINLSCVNRRAKMCDLWPGSIL